MPRLPDSSKPSLSERLSVAAHQRSRKTSRAIMRSYKLHLPRQMQMPLRIRPWFLGLTAVIMLMLALLGFTNVAQGIMNDKLEHALCLGIATGVFYFIFDVDEDARRIFIWRYAGLITTFLVCFICGGIISEFVQGLLPYKTFQWGDVIANLIGSSLGLWVAYNLEKYHRRRREISRLYQPIDTLAQSDSDSDDENEALVLPLFGGGVGSHLPPRTPMSSSTPKSGYGRGQSGAASGTGLRIGGSQGPRPGDVWDSREELFGIGEDDEDEEDELADNQRTSSKH